MTENSRVIKVDIFGESYSLKTDAPEAQVREIVKLVNDKMQQLAQGKSVINTKKLAVWAALDLAAELQELRGRCDRLLAEALRK